MVRISFILLFFNILEFSHACSCSLPSIKNSYNNSSLVFYAKHLGTDTVQGFHFLTNRPLVVENFELIRAYFEPVEKYRKSQNDQGIRNIVSLVSTQHDGCGMSFDKGKKYLVYAYRHLYRGFLTTDGCTRTREIINDDFSWAGEGIKDENKALLAMDLDQRANYFIQAIDEMGEEGGFSVHLFGIKNQLKMAEKQLEQRTSIICILAIFILTLVVYILTIRKKNRAT